MSRMSCAVSNHLSSFLNGLMVILFLPADASVAMPLIPNSTSYADLCVDLPMKCAEEMYEYHDRHDCTVLESAIRCMKRVLELPCDDTASLPSNSYDDYPIDTPPGHNETFVVGGDDPPMSILNGIEALLQESLMDWQTCSDSTTSNNNINYNNRSPSTQDTAYGVLLCAICLAFSFHSNSIS